VSQASFQKNTSDFPNLDERLSALASSRSECEYYAITLTADDKKNIIYDTMSYFVGWSEENPNWELRAPRLVYPQFCEIFWRQQNYPFACFHSVDDLPLFFLGGGHALIEKQLMHNEMQQFLQPSTSIKTEHGGFLHPDMFDPSSLRRAPTRKLRMEILKRDNRKCKICGRRPDDHVDVELHVHHIRPWAQGGLTLQSNLITLCHTCHAGLDPHFDSSLFEYLPANEKTMDGDLNEFLMGVSRYRKLALAGEI
jgi:hypothetical protein